MPQTPAACSTSGPSSSERNAHCLLSLPATATPVSLGANQATSGSASSPARPDTNGSAVRNRGSSWYQPSVTSRGSFKSNESNTPGGIKHHYSTELKQSPAPSVIPATGSRRGRGPSRSDNVTSNSKDKTASRAQSLPSKYAEPPYGAVGNSKQIWYSTVESARKKGGRSLSRVQADSLPRQTIPSETLRTRLSTYSQVSLPVPDCDQENSLVPPSLDLNEASDDHLQGWVVLLRPETFWQPLLDGEEDTPHIHGGLSFVPLRLKDDAPNDPHADSGATRPAGGGNQVTVPQRGSGRHSETRKPVGTGSSAG
ncbi:hypothetical protein TREMEDRAFT_60407 [Tremella mesenterica DSM 1558]|uniref:uncharacterized protein n=1 Tax=Tremella mesenterica (strain ATCC 24925 / CBS 8224 / DSM 1558 / NBRC 9311 / NRRL Y-6157 / RJB 2259-6 / UBC 559-6) TaxID=578456 RepID=UPI0003F4908C|nr:uncharacterized protein TREMEDRAFT_60407 [Tremella mesenterica DSM 1558]EIW71481.1 hypothetical protein TREMEDRAFT_60407 [Tremella mesenterica DSM 1558]